MQHYRHLSIVTFAFLLVACSRSADQQHGDATSGLSFIHLNDTYRISAVESGNAGGFGRVATTVRTAIDDGRDVRILHGGDFLYPSLESQLWHGAQMIETFNYLDALAPMYVVPGNHEFDRRTAAPLVNAIRQSTFDWLGDNYRIKTGDASIDERIMRQFTFEHGDKTVGIFSLMLHAEDGGNARDYVDVDRDYVGAAKRAIEAFEAAGVDLIIGLTHLHMETDRQIAALKREHPRFLFIVGGHEHEPDYVAATGASAAVMVGASNARVIWRIDVDFGADGMPFVEQNELLAMDRNVPADPGYGEIEAKWRDRLLDRFPFLTARVGEAAVPLDGREAVVRNAETSLGNFIVDQMRGAFGRPLADLAFLNSGSLRIDDVIAGDIIFEDIGRTFGFPSYLRHMTLSGAEFRAVLEAGFRGEAPSKGYFPQVSGFRVCVDRQRPDGERIVSLQVAEDDGYTEIIGDAEYTAVVPNYLYGGGDGYRFPEHREASRPGSELKYLVFDAIMIAQAQGEKVGAPVDPANPRIVTLGDGRDECWP